MTMDAKYVENRVEDLYTLKEGFDHADMTKYFKIEVREALMKTALDFYHRLNDDLYKSNKESSLDDEEDIRRKENAFDKLDSLLTSLEN